MLDRASIKVEERYVFQEGDLVSNKLCGWALASLLLVNPGGAFAARRAAVEQQEKQVSFEETVKKVTKESTTWAQKVVALHKFVREEIKQVKTSYA